ncbi:MAG: hypothetical protein K8963_09705 [Proteobacteria bacterium]|nr:hypothetical protein [Pseudomonadota bacterium]
MSAMNNPLATKSINGTFVFIFVCIALLSSCSYRAKDPALVAATQVDGIDYSAFTCEQLSAKEAQLQTRYDSAYSKQDARFVRDRRFFRAAIAAGILAGPWWGFLGFGVKGDSPGAPEELGFTQGNLQQLAAAKLEKSC